VSWTFASTRVGFLLKWWLGKVLLHSCVVSASWLTAFPLYRYSQDFQLQLRFRFLHSLHISEESGWGGENHRVLATLQFSLFFLLFTRRVLALFERVCVYLQFCFVVVFATAILYCILCVLWSYTHTYQETFFLFVWKISRLFRFPNMEYIYLLYFSAVLAKIIENAKKRKASQPQQYHFLTSLFLILSYTLASLIFPFTRKYTYKYNI